MTVTTACFDIVRSLVRDRSGVVLEADKEYLLSSQVEPLLGGWGLSSLAELAARLHAEPRGETARGVVEALLPSETYFFRDPAFFETLRRSVLPELVRRLPPDRSLSVWSAACSTGQEPYSLAMLLREDFPGLFHGRLRILATDFSRQALGRAREGRYKGMEVRRGLPDGLREKYFTPEGEEWRIDGEFRRVVEFREGNLRDGGPAGEGFDLVLARNVLIYFDLETKKRVLSGVRRCLSPGGYFFMGASETTLYLDDSFRGTAYEGGVTGYRMKESI